MTLKEPAKKYPMYLKIRFQKIGLRSISMACLPHKVKILNVISQIDLELQFNVIFILVSGN